MTAPQMGNTGVNTEDTEAEKPHVAGFIVHEISPMASNWRADATLDQYLKYLRKQNDIEDDWDSDNKARAVVGKGLFKPETLRIRFS